MLVLFNYNFCLFFLSLLLFFFNSFVFNVCYFNIIVTVNHKKNSKRIFVVVFGLIFDISVCMCSSIFWIVEILIESKRRKIKPLNQAATSERIIKNESKRAALSAHHTHSNIKKNILFFEKGKRIRLTTEMSTVEQEKKTTALSKLYIKNSK